MLLTVSVEPWLKDQRHQGEPISRNQLMKLLKLVKQVLRHWACRD
jgi:hypothetical protein